jgi:hypothetical protein
LSLPVARAILTFHGTVKRGRAPDVRCARAYVLRMSQSIYLILFSFTLHCVSIWGLSVAALVTTQCCVRTSATSGLHPSSPPSSAERVLLADGTLRTDSSTSICELKKVCVFQSSRELGTRGKWVGSCHAALPTDCCRSPLSTISRARLQPRWRPLVGVSYQPPQCARRGVISGRAAAWAGSRCMRANDDKPAMLKVPRPRFRRVRVRFQKFFENMDRL